MLKLMGEVADLPAETVPRVEHALAGIAKLVGADFAFSTRIRHTIGKTDVEPYAIMSHRLTPAVIGTLIDVGQRDPYHTFVLEGMNDKAAMPGAVVSEAGEWPYALSGVRLSADRQRARAGASQEMLDAADCDMDVAILHPAAADGHFATLALLRTRGGKSLGDREIKIARLLWEGLSFLHRSPVVKVDDRLWVTPLPPRLARVLERLRQGDSVKQAARRLGLSTHTVTGYVKDIYRHFGVSSRAELLAALG